MRRIRLTRAAVVGVVVTGALGLVSMLGVTDAQASSASVVEVGWWTAQPGASPAPDGGFQVANGVNGPQSVAAVRVRKEHDPGTVTLQLTPAGAGVNEDAAAKLQICPIVADWKPANPGKPTDAPKYDCATTVAVAKDASGAWSADITALLSRATEGQPVSMMVVPVGTQLAGGLQLPFQINFSGASVPGPPGAGGAGTGPASGSSPVVPSRPSPVTGTAGAAGVGSRPAITASPPHPGAGPANAPSAAPATPSTANNQQAVGPTVHIANAGGSARKPWGRLVYLVPLSALGGLVVALGRKAAQQRGVVGQAA